MPKQKTVHILSHTHWDREWYLDSKYTNEWLVPFFENLFVMFEREPDYKFILDGQLSMVDDWFEQLTRRGQSVAEAKGRIRRYVGQGRLVIGPYYLQPDWQIVSGEALVRNLFLGKKMASDLGGSQKSGWLLDNFGQISQTAQIHAGFGLRGLYVWRGIYMEPDEVKSEFLWKSPDGTVLPSIYLINSYRNAMRLASTPDLVDTRISDEVKRMAPFNTTSHVLLMNGYDQDIEPDDVIAVLRTRKPDAGLRVVQSTPEEYLDAVLAEKPTLPTLEGPQYVGRYISVFPGVLSARIYLKQQNDLSQHTLERVLEPLAALNHLQGGEYEAGFLEGLWKLLLKNHPHDSICGVSIDPVHTDMEYRHHLIQRLAGEKLDRDLAEVCARIDTASVARKTALVVFNSSPNRRDAVVRYQSRFLAVSDIPGGGWKTIDAEALPTGTVRITVGEGEFVHCATNGLVDLAVRTDGTFDVTHRASGRVYSALGALEDSGDAGDLYNYSWPDRDVVVTSLDYPATIRIVSSSPVAVEFRIETVLRVPEGLSDDGGTRSSRLVDLPIVTLVTLESGSPVVKVSTRLRNTAKNHAVRVLFPSGLKVDHSHGGSPFDVTRRPLHTGDFDEASLPPELKAVIVGAREPRSNTFFHGQGFADVSDGSVGLAVLNRGLPEYEVRRDGCLALTLFRGVAIIAGQINTRLGDAGPHMLTPDGQCLRDLSFEYAVYPHGGDVYQGDVARMADAFVHPVLVAETAAHGGLLKPTEGWCEVVVGTLVLSAFKRADRGPHLVLRVCNPTEKACQAQLAFGRKLSAAWLCDLDEQRQEALSVSGNTLEFDLGAKAICTLELALERFDVPAAPASATVVDQVLFEDFSSFAGVPLVSEAELHGELARAARLAERMDDVMFRRPALEAHLSAILATARFEESAIRRLGLELNDARVQRRLHDYVAAYKRP